MRYLMVNMKMTVIVSFIKPSTQKYMYLFMSSTKRTVATVHVKNSSETACQCVSDNDRNV